MLPGAGSARCVAMRRCCVVTAGFLAVSPVDPVPLQASWQFALLTSHPMFLRIACHTACVRRCRGVCFSTGWSCSLLGRSQLAVAVLSRAWCAQYFVLWGEPNYMCPEPWLGAPSSLSNGKGLVTVAPGESASWGFQVTHRSLDAEPG